jgi:hypothetical protein
MEAEMTGSAMAGKSHERIMRAGLGVIFVEENGAGPG